MTRKYAFLFAFILSLFAFTFSLSAQAKLEPIDIFDLFYHSMPWILLLTKLIFLVKKKGTF